MEWGSLRQERGLRDSRPQDRSLPGDKFHVPATEYPASDREGKSHGQIRRAEVSILASIREGEGRKSLGESIERLSVANGSLKELETHRFIATTVRDGRDAEMIPLLECCSEIEQWLATFNQKVRENNL